MPAPRAVSFAEAARLWFRIGWLSFGGPAGQIALMHRELVTKRRWLGEERFLHALNFCMLLPGPEAQQLAVYSGWLLNGVRGGLVAGLSFILPGALTILALSVIYALHGEVLWVEALFYGLKAAVLAIVLEAVFRIGRRALRAWWRIAVAAGAYVAIAFYAVPFPIVILAAVIVGLLAHRLGLEMNRLEDQVAESSAAGPEEVWDLPVRRARPLLTLVVGLALWWAPVVLLALTVGRDHVWVREGIFFSKAAVVTFGGAYAVLAYVAQQAVVVFQWLSSAQMLDGLGLAETTPGPLILVVQFVGFMAAFHHSGSLDPVLSGVIGSLVVSWVTFTPSFLWIFLGAPYIERLRDNRYLAAGFSAITAAVVGVILNLSLWFALHTLSGELVEQRILGARLLVANPATLDWFGLLLALLSFLAIWRLRWGIVRVIALAAASGLAYRLATAGL